MSKTKSLASQDEALKAEYLQLMDKWAGFKRKGSEPLPVAYAVDRDRMREIAERRDQIGAMEHRVRLLLRNGLVSKSGVTLADTGVLKELALRLGYDLKRLAALDLTDTAVNPYAKT